jgi:hypothetical protein
VSVGGLTMVEAVLTPAMFRNRADRPKIISPNPLPLPASPPEPPDS